jgi:hypothetical protein
MKQKKKRPAAPLKRKLHFPDDEIWSYAISGHGLRIRSPEGKTTKVSMSDFTGWTPAQLERASWKKYWPEIGPQDVKDYITKNLRG